MTGHEWERLPATVLAAWANPQAAVVISVPIEMDRYTCHRCGERIQQFVDAGVNRARIVELRPAASNTRGEADAGADYARRAGTRRVLAVTTDPMTLGCAAGDGANCLTRKQALALKKIYQGPVNPRTGRLLRAGLPPGSEARGASRVSVAHTGARFDMAMAILPV